MKMTPEEFVYWLQGYVEINGDLPDEAQWAAIVNKLGTVFDKQTPAYTINYQAKPSIGPLVQIC